MPTTTDASAFARALASERADNERLAERVEPLAYGVGYFDDRVPRCYIANALWVQGEQDVDARTLIADAERLHAAAGHEHRWITVEHEPLWRALREDFDAAGWTHQTLVYLEHRGEPDRLVDTSGVREVAIDELETAERRYIASASGDSSAQTVDQLVCVRRHAGETLGERRFAAHVDGRVAGYAKLRPHADVAQLDDVVVLAEHRGRGLGRAVVTAALRAAIQARPQLTFIIADDDDWPRELYVRLGFAPIGRTRIYRRLPGPS